MPFTDPPPLPGLASTLQTIGRRLDAIEAKITNMGNASTIATDAIGKTRMVFGALGNSLWGIQILDANGDILIQLDQNGLHAYDTSGHQLVQLDSVGLHAYNTSGQEEARLGQLNSSPAIYGLGVLPYGGSQLQQVGGALTAGPGSLSTSSTTPVNFGSSITAEIGPSGQVLVSLTGKIETNGGTNPGYGYMGVSIDSGTATDWIDNYAQANQQQIETLGTTRLVSSLSPGTHTFQAAGWQSAQPTSVQCSAVYVTVQPL